MLALTINILFLLTVKVGHGHGVLIFAITPFDGKWLHLQMSPTHFCASFCHFRYVIFLIVYLQKVGQGHSTIFTITSFDANCKNLQISPIHVYTRFYHFRD